MHVCYAEILDSICIELYLYLLFVQTQLTITFAPMLHISLVEMFINILTCVK